MPIEFKLPEVSEGVKTVDVAQVHVQALGQLFRGNAPVDCPLDHHVLLHSGQAVDPVVVGVGFVVGGNQALGFLDLQLFHGHQTGVSVQQDMQASISGWTDGQRFNQSD